MSVAICPPPVSGPIDEVTVSPAVRETNWRLRIVGLRYRSLTQDWIILAGMKEVWCAASSLLQQPFVCSLQDRIMWKKKKKNHRNPLWLQDFIYQVFSIYIPAKRITSIYLSSFFFVCFFCTDRFPSSVHLKVKSMTWPTQPNPICHTQTHRTVLDVFFFFFLRRLLTSSSAICTSVTSRPWIYW